MNGFINKRNRLLVAKSCEAVDVCGHKEEWKARLSMAAKLDNQQLATLLAHTVTETWCQDKEIKRMQKEEVLLMDTIYLMDDESCMSSLDFTAMSREFALNNIRHPSSYMLQSACPPSIDIASYFRRIAKYSFASAEALLMAAHYLFRVKAANPTLAVNALTIHRLYLTAVMIAAKFFDDRYMNCAWYAKVGGITLQELRDLEVELLMLLDYQLFVSYEDYCDTYRQLVTLHPCLPKFSNSNSPQLVSLASPSRLRPSVTFPPLPFKLNKTGAAAAEEEQRTTPRISPPDPCFETPSSSSSSSTTIPLLPRLLCSATSVAAVAF